MDYLPVFICAAAAIVVRPAAAQDPETPHQIIVTGTRFQTPLDQAGRSITVLTAEEIELRQHRTVFDALSTVPGVQIIRSGGAGALATVSLRGLPSGQTLVVQDGVVLNNPSSFANSFNFADLDTAGIERIEVLRGAQSTLYGSDAIGGVINIVTKDGRDGFGGDVFAEGGSFAAFRGAASLYGGNDRASGRLTLSGITTRGFSAADEANGNSEDDGSDNFSISTKARFEPMENLVFDAVVRYQDSKNEFDGFAGVPVDGDEIGETNEFSVAAFATHKAFGGALENRLSITYLRNDRLNLSNGAASFDALGTRISYEYQSTLKPAEWISVIAGAEYDKQESTVTVGFGGNQEIETVSGFGLIQFRPVSFATVNAGIRHDASSDFSNETTFSVSAAVDIPITDAILRGSFAEGFRAPTAGELGFNRNLFAEFSDGWDIGIEQSLLDGRARLSATYFDHRIDDLIAFDLAAFTFVNIQEFSTRGVEIALDAAMTDWLTVSASYTFTDAINLSTRTAAGNQPDDRINFELALRPADRLTLSLGASYNGEEADGAQTLDSFVLVNVRAAYALTDGIELFARVENATDADYQDNFGYGTAPASAFGGVKARF